jgi:hypothetical protein
MAVIFSLSVAKIKIMIEIAKIIFLRVKIFLLPLLLL